MMLKIASLFSGIGTPEQSLKHLNVRHETVFACEIDKYARKTYLENNQEPNTFYEDIYKIDGTKYENQIDIIIGGSPCQSFSIAGKRKGVEDARGSLIHEYFRMIEEIKPKVFIYENVKGFLSIDKENKKDKYGTTFLNFTESFRELGYKIYFEVLNTKDYGIPQNRERIYIVGFKDELEFEFQEKQELKLRLKDMLEAEVDEKYLLKQYQIENIENSKFNQKKNIVTESESDYIGTLLSRDYKDPKVIKLKQTHTLDIKGNDSIKRIYDANGLAPSLTTMQGGHREPKVAIEKEIIKLFDIPKSILNDNERQRRVYSADGISPAVIARSDSAKVAISNTIKPSVAKNIQRDMEDILKSKKDFYVCKAEAGWQDNKVGLKISPTIRANNSSIYGLDRVNYIFRKLTPRECFRLQGFDDSFTFPEKMSNTQLYKQAGNGMSRNVLDMIITQVLKSYHNYIESKGNK